jgi:predicted transcriptional regulator
MHTPKEQVLDVLKGVPEDATFEEIQYRIYVRAKIEHALRQVDAGQVMEQAEVDTRLAKWLAE